MKQELIDLIEKYLDDTLQDRTTGIYTNLGYRVNQGSFEGFLIWLKEQTK